MPSFVQSGISNSLERSRLIIVLLLLLPVISLIGGNVVIDRLITLGLFIISLALGMRERYLVNPFFLFSLVPLTLIIYINVGNSFMLDLSHSTWLLAIINISAFLFALIRTPNFNYQWDCIGPHEKKGLYLYTFIFYGISLLGRIIPALASVLWIFSVPAMVCALKTKDIRMIVIVAIVLVSSLFSSVSKMTVLLQLLTILICYERYYVKTRRQKQFVVLLLIASVFFMIIAFSFANKDRGNYDSEEGLEYYSQQGADWTYNSAFFLPYMYLTTPWANLQYVTETQDYRTNGIWTIKPLLGYFGADDFYAREYEFGLVPYSSFNTFTFIVCGFKDFGFWGSIIVSFLLGFFVKIVYSRYKLSRSPLDVASYICVALAVAEMFFSNHFLMQSYPFTCFILMELLKPIFRFINNAKAVSYLEVNQFQSNQNHQYK